MDSQNCEQQRGSDTPTQRLASLLLGSDVRDFIAQRRDEKRAYRWIARDLFDATDGQIDVTYETVRGWHERETAA